MPHNLRDLLASKEHFEVVGVVMSDVIKDGQWITAPVVCGVYPASKLVVLYIANDLVDEASELWPHLTPQEPDNSRLVTAQ